MTKKIDDPAIPPTLPTGEIDWSKMPGRPMGRPIDKTGLAIEAQFLYRSYVPSVSSTAEPPKSDRRISETITFGKKLWEEAQSPFPTFITEIKS